ncbi:MAG: ribosomal L7Ae/L30e/S12e/Gadd45 family protein [Candidatus Cloacimonetes bacterium]|jgi:ribosomal protein L7Ae-like RNA K-turn-binding protein|nr:ribosomal L7Ae/L30e/S12e/Gadd45 family protein [Candidatus Cloacimonadota bacterium]MDD4223307.1 ribosomal L7Ae/L30e/S12e/Gadd45 family protein [Candidatus Cloacimonadota bacterium]
MMESKAELTRKIVNLMQFARKAGKLTAGADACLRELHSRGLRLVIIASDTAERTAARIEAALRERGDKVATLRLGTQEELSAALGLPLTGIFGITDKQFATRMLEYSAGIAKVEEQSANTST